MSRAVARQFQPLAAFHTVFVAKCRARSSFRAYRFAFASVDRAKLDTAAAFRYQHGMRRQPKDNKATDQFLWPDPPGATERLMAGKIPHTTSADILSAWTFKSSPVSKGLPR